MLPLTRIVVVDPMALVRFHFSRSRCCEHLLQRHDRF